MNRNQVDSWREVSQIRLEELTVVNAKQSSEISHIKETVVLGSLIGWLYKGDA